MYAQTAKPKVHKSRSVVKSFPKSQSQRHPKVGIVDKRLEAVAACKHQALMNNNSERQKLVQRKTLGQAGKSGELQEGSWTDLAGRTLGPDQGKIYSIALDPNSYTSDVLALDAAATTYAKVTADISVDEMLGTNRIFEVMDWCKQNYAQPFRELHVADTELEATARGRAEKALYTLVAERIHKELKPNPCHDEVTLFRNALFEAIEVKCLDARATTREYRISTKGRERGPARESIKFQMNEWCADANVKPLDPFVLEITGAINGSNFMLSYQHGPDLPGYVTRVKWQGQDLTLKYDKSTSSQEQFGVPSYYSAHHRYESAPEAPLLTHTKFDLSASEYANEGVADTLSKLAGESARYDCVRAALASVRDTTRFYVHVSDTERRYVTLKDLWLSWESMFKKANGIPDEKVKEAITNGKCWNIEDKKGSRSSVWTHDDPYAGHAIDLTNS